MFTRLLIILTLSCPIVFAADPPSPGSGSAGTAPSDASIKQLLEVTQTHKMLDSTMAQMNAFMTQMMQQATQGQKITPQIQKDIDKRQSEMMAPLIELLDWSEWEHMYVRLYHNSFTQLELDGLICYCKPSPGQAAT